MRRPTVVLVAALLQLLLAATFLISVGSALLFGAAAQRAAEAELARQGFPASLLTAENLRFDEGPAGVLPAMIIAAVLIMLAILNLRGHRAGRLISWIFQPLLVVAGLILVSGQVFLEAGLEQALARSGVTGVDVPALVAAARAAFPWWYPAEAWLKLIFVTVGQLVTVVLLALPSARAYVRAVHSSPVARG